MEDMSDDEIKKMKSVVVIDCTWFQTKPLIDDIIKEGQGRVKFIKLKDY
jgi:hypothetical protein